MNRVQHRLQGGAVKNFGIVTQSTPAGVAGCNILPTLFSIEEDNTAIWLINEDSTVSFSPHHAKERLHESLVGLLILLRILIRVDLVRACVEHSSRFELLPFAQDYPVQGELLQL